MQQRNADMISEIIYILDIDTLILEKGNILDIRKPAAWESVVT